MHPARCSAPHRSASAANSRLPQARFTGLDRKAINIRNDRRRIGSFAVSRSAPSHELASIHDFPSRLDLDPAWSTEEVHIRTMAIFCPGGPNGIDIFAKKAVLQFDGPFANLGNGQLISRIDWRTFHAGNPRGWRQSCSGPSTRPRVTVESPPA